MINVLITGSDGFIGKNLISHLSDQENINPIYFNKKNSLFDLYKKILICDTIIHLAAINRSNDNSDFLRTNFKLTKLICDFIVENKLKKTIIYISSIHDVKNTVYGESKKLSISYLKKISAKKNSISVLVLRLSRVFGKWSKPNYNSAIATFCYSIQNGFKAKVINPKKKLDLNYIDDVINEIIEYLKLKKRKNFLIKKVIKDYTLSTEEIYNKIQAVNLKNSIRNISGLANKKNIEKYLYATFMSFLPKKKITQKLKTFKDKRGSFTEILKTSEDGQFSFFTCEPGEVRGNHFHNTKLEKFLVVKGKAEFQLRDLHSEKVYKFILDENKPELINSIPGYVHNIKNIGKEKLIVFVWANEIFKKKKPDTMSKNV
jgi:UDP-2-acetamido-2,6-beta-L-arabino-hexul-4-ose reductase